MSASVLGSLGGGALSRRCVRRKVDDATLWTLPLSERSSLRTNRQCALDTEDRLRAPFKADAMTPSMALAAHDRRRRASIGGGIDGCTRAVERGERPLQRRRRSIASERRYSAHPKGGLMS